MKLSNRQLFSFFFIQNVLPGPGAISFVRVKKTNSHVTAKPPLLENVIINISDRLRLLRENCFKLNNR